MSSPIFFIGLFAFICGVVANEAIAMLTGLVAVQIEYAVFRINLKGSKK